MWSALVDVEIENNVKTEPRLRDQMILLVKQSPGFVTGYWMNLDNHTGTSFVVYDFEEHARASPPPRDLGECRVSSSSRFASRA